jgi:surface polysaccharide O-acyltransferase-like enzyme
MNVNLIRGLAILLVIILHAGPSFPVSPFYSQVPGGEVGNWWIQDFYSSIAWPCVPLFVIVSGALLLTPSKTDEPLRTFFRKRLARIGLPFLFWGLVYFAWRVFANHEILTFDTIWRGFLGAGQYPYYHFWFLYMLVGLYLITPILRIVISHASSRIVSYFILLCFVSTAVPPLLIYFGSVWFSSFIFIVPGWVGYFILGAYLRNKRLASWILFAALFLSIAWTMVGNWFVTAAAGATAYVGTIFTDYLSLDVILASAAMFLLCCAAPTQRFAIRFPRANWLLTHVGLYSFAIYLLHPMILEMLGQKGLFGYNVGIITLNPILGIPILSLVTLTVCVGVIWLLRKVPMLNRTIG